MRVSPFTYLLSVVILWGALFYESVWSTILIWERSPTFNHGFLIAPICIYLVYQKWEMLIRLPFAVAWRAVIAIIPAVFLWVAGQLSHIAFVEQFAAFLLLPMMLWFFCGNAFMKELLFVCFFWMFSVPVGEFLVPDLQNITADFTVFFLELSGVPVYREGLFIAIPNGLFEVAAACSGIRYLIASFCLGTLYAYLNYTKWKKRLGFVAFSLVLPIIANGIRAYGIILIAHLSNMEYATGVDHIIYGWIWFAVVLLIMFSVGNRWRDPVNQAPAYTTPVPSKQINLSFLASLVAFGVIFAMHLVYLNVAGHPTLKPVPAFAQQFAEEYQGERTWLPVFKDPDFELIRTRDDVDMYLAYYQHNRDSKELIKGTHKPYNDLRWSLEQSQTFDTFRLIEITSPGGAKRLIAYAYVIDGLITPSTAKVKLSQLKQAVLGQTQNGFFIAYSIRYDGSNTRKQQFIETVKPLLSANLLDELDGD